MADVSQTPAAVVTPRTSRTSLQLSLGRQRKVSDTPTPIKPSPGPNNTSSTFRSIRNLLPFGQAKPANGRGPSDTSAKAAANTPAPVTPAKHAFSAFGSLRWSMSLDRKPSGTFHRPEDVPAVSVESSNTVREEARPSPSSSVVRLLEDNALKLVGVDTPDRSADSSLGSCSSVEDSRAKPLPPAPSPSRPVAGADLSTIMEAETSGISRYLPNFEDSAVRSSSPESTHDEFLPPPLIGHTLSTSTDDSIFDLSTSKLNTEVLNALRNEDAAAAKEWLVGADGIVVDRSTHFPLDENSRYHPGDVSVNFDGMDPDLAALLSPHRVTTSSIGRNFRKGTPISRQTRESHQTSFHPLSSTSCPPSPHLSPIPSSPPTLPVVSQSETDKLHRSQSELGPPISMSSVRIKEQSSFLNFTTTPFERESFAQSSPTRRSFALPHYEAEAAREATLTGAGRAPLVPSTLRGTLSITPPAAEVHKATEHWDAQQDIDDTFKYMNVGSMRRRPNPPSPLASAVPLTNPESPSDTPQDPQSIDRDGQRKASGGDPRSTTPSRRPFLTHQATTPGHSPSSPTRSSPSSAARPSPTKDAYLSGTSVGPSRSSSSLAKRRSLVPRVSSFDIGPYSRLETPRRPSLDILSRSSVDVSRPGGSGGLDRPPLSSLAPSSRRLQTQARLRTRQRSHSVQETLPPGRFVLTGSTGSSSGIPSPTTPTFSTPSPNTRSSSALSSSVTGYTYNRGAGYDGYGPGQGKQRVYSARYVSEGGGTPDGRPQAMEWLGPRTVKAFAAAGLLDNDRDTPLVSRPTRVVSERYDRTPSRANTPSRAGFSDASGGSTTSWGRPTPRGASGSSEGWGGSPTFTTTTTTGTGTSGRSGTSQTSLTSPRTISSLATSPGAAAVELNSVVQDLKEKHAAETEALLGALRDSQAVAKGTREEMGALRTENEGLRDEVEGLREENERLRVRMEGLEAEVRAMRVERYRDRDKERGLDRGDVERWRTPRSETTRLASSSGRALTRPARGQRAEGSVDLTHVAPPNRTSTYLSSSSKWGSPSSGGRHIDEPITPTSRASTTPDAMLTRRADFAAREPSPTAHRSHHSYQQVYQQEKKDRRNSSTSSIFPNVPPNMSLLMLEKGGSLPDFEASSALEPRSRSQSPQRFAGSGTMYTRQGSYASNNTSAYAKSPTEPSSPSFCLTELNGSPTSLQLRPEHEVHLGDMANLSLYPMSDGEDARSF